METIFLEQLLSSSTRKIFQLDFISLNFVKTIGKSFLVDPCMCGEGLALLLTIEMHSANA